MKRGDNELVQASLAGDRGAFGELVGRYEASLYNLALRVTGNVEDAMDATQNAFLKAYDNLDRFDSSHRFFSWIYRIGLNESLNIVSRRQRFTPIETEVAGERAGPEDECWGHEAGREIREALAELTPEYRAVVVLRHLEGLSYREMAEALGVPMKTVKSRLFTARRELRRRLAEKGVTA